jgi:uncharacterized DUF497 family protein
MAFEWDEGKRQANVVKHGVDFRQMPELFDGPTVEAVDDRFNYGVTPTNCLGEIEGRFFRRHHHLAWRRSPNHQREESQCAGTKNILRACRVTRRGASKAKPITPASTP